MTTCENCGGEGGFYALGGSLDDQYPTELWTDCPECHGSGWVCGVPPEIDPEEAWE